MLGVDPDALAQFVDHHNPTPGKGLEKDGETIFAVGNEMALALEKMNPHLAQRWRLVNYLQKRSKRMLS